MLVSGLPLDLWYATSMVCVCRYFPTFLCCVVSAYMWDRLVSVTDRGGVPDSRQKAACRVVCEPQCSDWGQSLELYWIKFTQTHRQTQKSVKHTYHSYSIAYTNIGAQETCDAHRSSMRNLVHLGLTHSRFTPSISRRTVPYSSGIDLEL